jgi:hypothetical protein
LKRANTVVVDTTAKNALPNTSAEIASTVGEGAGDRDERADRGDADHQCRDPAAAPARHQAAPHPELRNGADADAGPERALRQRPAAGIAYERDHEGHVGDVACAEQEVTGEIKQDWHDRDIDGPGLARHCGFLDFAEAKDCGQQGRDDGELGPGDPP